MILNMKHDKGLIYFAQLGDAGPVKIGYSANTETLVRRMDTLQNSNPEPLYLRGVIRGTQAEEQRILTLFFRHRLRGEWFYPSEDLIGHVETMADNSVGELSHMLTARRSGERMPDDDAIKLWLDPALTYRQALDAMWGWSGYMARKVLGPKPIDRDLLKQRRREWFAKARDSRKPHVPNSLKTRWHAPAMSKRLKLQKAIWTGAGTIDDVRELLDPELSGCSSRTLYDILDVRRPNDPGAGGRGKTRGSK